MIRTLARLRTLRRPTPLHLFAALAALLAFLGSGCARVQPWERDILSDRSMQIGADGIDLMIDDHIYFSKEGTSGGRGIGGGGCGCN